MIVLLCTSGGSVRAALAKVNCGGLLSSNPKIAYVVRSSGLLGQQKLLPRQVEYLDNDVLNQKDIEAWAISKLNSHAEVAYFQALDHAGHVIAETEVLGGKFQVDPEEALNRIQELLGPMDRRRHLVSKIRMVHTHPPHLFANLFSPSDITAMLVVHALFEALGGNEIEIEASILCLDVKMPELPRALLGYPFALTKKTYRLPGNSLSHANGDYALPNRIEKTLTNLRNTMSEKNLAPRYNWPLGDR